VAPGGMGQRPQHQVQVTKLLDATPQGHFGLYLAIQLIKVNPGAGDRFRCWWTRTPPVS
jgi:hypothetical protein